MNRSRRTVADLRAPRGERQLSMIHIESMDEARAASAAGIDLLSIETPRYPADGHVLAIADDEFAAFEAQLGG